MTEDRKIKLNGNLNLLISLSNAADLARFAVWLGQKMERPRITWIPTWKRRRNVGVDLSHRKT